MPQKARAWSDREESCETSGTDAVELGTFSATGRPAWEEAESGAI